jgi:hypothetical protein
MIGARTRSGVATAISLVVLAPCSGGEQGPSDKEIRRLAQAYNAVFPPCVDSTPRDRSEILRARLELETLIRFQRRNPRDRFSFDSSGPDTSMTELLSTVADHARPDCRALARTARRALRAQAASD